MAEAAPPALDRRGVLLRVLAVCAVMLLVLGSLWAAVAGMGGREALAQNLSRVSVPWLLGSLAVMMVALMFSGPRLTTLLPPAEGRWRRPGGLAVGSLLMGVSVLNLSLPGPAGEVVAAMTLKRVYGVPVATALATGLHARFAGLAMGGLMLLVLLPFVEVPPEIAQGLWLLGGLLGVAGAAAGAVSFRPGLLVTAARLGPRALAAIAPQRLEAPLARVATMLEGMARDLAAGAVLRPVAWLRAAAWSVAAHLVFAIAVAGCGKAVGVEVVPMAAVVGQCASVVASVALIMVPGGLGAWDVAFGGVLVLAGGLSTEDAALVLLAVRLCQVVGMLPSSLFFLGWSRHLLTGAARVAAGDTGATSGRGQDGTEPG